MTIYNFSISSDDVNDEKSILKQISLNTKIQIERLTLNKQVTEKKLSISNPLDCSKNYFIVFNDKSLHKILYQDTDSKYILLTQNALYVENKEQLSFNFLDLDDSIECDFFYIVDDLLSQQQKKYSDLMERNEKQINNNIFIIDDRDILSYEFCDRLIKYLESLDKKQIEKWEAKQNVNCKYINIESIEDETIKKEFDDALFEITGKVINYLHNRYGLSSTGDSGYCLRKIYGPTRAHSDGITVTAVQNGKYIPIRKVRNLSLIMALNEDYEGGEFYFPIQDYKVKLKKGQIIAFPPYWTHRHMVNAPINGTYRYTINTWLFE